MSSTHLSLHYHIVFSTKNREPIIADQWRHRLHAYLGGTVRTIGGVAEAIGGTRDHVHLLIRLRATHSLSDVLREIKSTSSKWIHETPGVKAFIWQEGYGAATVSPSKSVTVSHYIAKQEDHHRNRTFQEEYVEFLKESGVEFDERYLW